MRKLYLDIDGVFLTKKRTRPADNVLPFIDFVINHFDCYFLTTHCKGDCKTALNYLGQFFDEITVKKFERIKPTNWATLKTEAIDFSEDFFWLDDNQFQSEVKIMESAGKLDRLLLVNLENQDELLKIQTRLQG